jgi:hypothetical protein
MYPLIVDADAQLVLFGIGQNRSMMPSPSPGVNGPAEDQQSGRSGTHNLSTGLTHDPSQNTLNPGKQSQGDPHIRNVGQGEIISATPNQDTTTASSSAILNNPPSVDPSIPSSTTPDSMPSGLFSNDFIQSVASSLQDEHLSMFRPDGHINFERDFEQWLNDNNVGSLDSK